MLTSCSQLGISIHAPTRGATFYNLCSPLLLENFNPRSHERSDHIPLKPFYTVCIYFNPRSHERSDASSLHRRYPLRFQSTLPREERRLLTRTSNITRLFQSTLPREERHQAYYYLMQATIISIHAPTRGATYLR